LNANIVTGKVGINTTTPGEALEIDGNIKLQQNDAIIWNTNDAVLKSNFSQPAFTFHSSGGELFSLERDGSTILFKNRTGNGYSTILDADSDTIIKRGGTEKLVVSSTVISGSSTSTGSFGAVTIGKGTADNDRALTVVGNAQFDNNAQIYFKRSSGTADPYISYDSSDNFNIFNPVAGEIRFAVGSGYILDIESTGINFNGSKSLTTSTGAGVITVNGNSGVILKSGTGGGSGPIQFMHGSTVVSEVTTTHAISGSSTSTGSFGRVEVNSISASLYQGQIGSRYVHSQTSDSATWTINHNIGHKYPVVTVYDSSDQMILPENGVATDSDTFTLSFNEAITGKAVVSVGGIGENAGANYIHTQESANTNWRVTHSLSQQYPNITVYDSNDQVIIPESITAASSNETDITFSDNQSGYANFSIGSGIPNISSQNAGKVLKVRAGGQGVEWSPTSNDVSGSMSVSGSILPTIDNHHNLGSESLRWANLHTGDIQLSNEGTEGNEVDGTTGKWTIQEGEDDLYLLNRKNGKKYKFKLEEIT